MSHDSTNEQQLAQSRARESISPHASALSYISAKACVRDSPIHGRGLFAAEPFAKDEIVAIKGGYVFTRATRREIESQLGPAEIQIADDLFIGPRHASEREDGMIFSNHSCDPNMGVRGQIVFVAMRDVRAGEELTHDWAMTDDDAYRMECRCGALNCRKIITGQDWRRKELQDKYDEYMSWYLREKIKKSSG